uniref:Medium-chain acyl-[acyl-carrier-protein] hydrolase n=1 Tax=Candidatus Kentrum sp. FW TaxID=2126338 RepID=A0A450TTH7_9GAMM|nr:MAG: medium-chain acyl-[acyl-carrier-protein] hydrolase [Candidatus Kentron sp. FW]
MNPWISGTANPQAEARLFCFPFAGGGTLIYRDWHGQLPARIEPRPVRLPGREGRFQESCYRDAIPLARALASGLSPYLDLPFAFFGHSVGALLAFELARELRRQGGPEPFCLMVSGRRAPQIPLSRRPLYNLPTPALIRELRNYGGTPEIVLREQELMALFLPVIRADFAINETYRHIPETPLDCPICAFGGETDPMASEAELDAWRQQTTGGFTRQMFPGDHFYLNGPGKPPLMHALAMEFEASMPNIDSQPTEEIQPKRPIDN